MDVAPVLRLGRPLECAATMFAGDGFHHFRLFAHAGLGPVELEQQQRLFRQTQLVMRIDRPDAILVDEFDPRDRHADLDGLDYRADRIGSRRE